jgi:hypothetical protein
MARSLKTRNARLTLQSFDDRIVPAVVDLTTAGASGVANGAIFQQFDAPARANGVNTFLQVDGRGVEQGYNTDGREQRFGGGNEFSGKSIKLSQVPLVTGADGSQYRAFNIDVREPGSSSLVSLDELRIYTDSSRKLTGYDASNQTLGGKAAVYDMDGAGDTVVRFNADLNSRRSRGDAFVYIPNSVFAGASDSDYVYLYSKLGVTNGASGGAESWSIRNAPTPPAVGGGDTGSISGTVFYDHNANGVLESGDGDFGIGDATTFVKIHLVGQDSSGNAVDLTTWTDANGNYSFTGIKAGTYSVYQVHAPFDGDMPQVFDPQTQQLVNLINGGDYIGLNGGNTVSIADTYDSLTDTGTDGILGISLAAGTSATGYNFTMVQQPQS